MGEQQSNRVKCIVAYDGTNYHGFQSQPKEPSIQEEIEKALARIHKSPITVFGSGRTDAGVHARGQVIHFDSPLQMEPSAWNRALNTYLPADIRIRSTEQVPPDFHARYDVVKKEYRYQIYHSRIPDPSRRLYWLQVRYAIDIERMKEAANLFLGEHDFTAFTSGKSKVRSKVRTIYRLELEQNSVAEGEELTLICEGNGFLYNMVRIMAGTILDVGRGKRTLEHVQRALQEKDRAQAGILAPAHGLYLWQVDYE